jgi:hypothetical protein
MAKISSKSPVGTSYHSVNISATPAELIKKFGEPQWGYNDGKDKVNMEWVLETTEYPNEWNVPKGTVFTIYDWKEYRPLEDNEVIQWHIGAKNSIISWQAQDEVNKWEELSLKRDGLSNKDINVMRDLGMF